MTYYLYWQLLASCAAAQSDKHTLGLHRWDVTLA
jgi:hypothetical protein